MSEATARPWGIEHTLHDNWIGPMRKSGDGKIAEIVCQTECSPHLTEEARARNNANADLIVEAVNAYDPLRAQLAARDAECARLRKALDACEQILRARLEYADLKVGATDGQRMAHTMAKAALAPREKGEAGG